MGRFLLCSAGEHFDAARDIGDLKGKVIIVTGGSAGLGKATVLELAKHKPEQIFIASRTQSKAEEAIQEIKAIVPDSRIAFLECNLASFKSIKAASETFLTQSQRLDILINNAGIFGTPFSKTEDGYEIQFATNHVGPALLTRLLLPTLLATAGKPGSDVRVVNVSSMAHSRTKGLKFDQDALRRMASSERYAQSKLANILYLRELQKRHPSLTATSVHPGAVWTDLLEAGRSPQYPLSTRIITKIMRLLHSLKLLPEVAEGAKNQLWAATASREEVRAGYYWSPVGKRSHGSKQAQDEKLGIRLWDWTEKVFSSNGY